MITRDNIFQRVANLMLKLHLSFLFLMREPFPLNPYSLRDLSNPLTPTRKLFWTLLSFQQSSFCCANQSKRKVQEKSLMETQLSRAPISFFFFFRSFFVEMPWTVFHLVAPQRRAKSPWNCLPHLLSHVLAPLLLVKGKNINGDPSDYNNNT